MTVKKSQTGPASPPSRGWGEPRKKKARADAAIGGALTIERVPFDRVNPAPYNPRVALTEADAEWQAIERSLGTFGYVEPMVWNRRTGTLVAGHQRLRILKSKGVTEADFSIVDLPEAEEKALNLALNRIKGRWDDEALASLLAELKDAEIELEVTGFDVHEIESLLADAERAAEEAEHGAAPSDPAPVLALDDYRVINGDSLEVLQTLADASFDLILTDPPYGHSNNDGDLIERREAALGQRKKRDHHANKNKPRPIANDGAEANELLRSCIPHFRRLLRHGGCCCCCCCCCGGPDPQFARWSLWLDEHLDFKQMVVWDKGPIGMGWHYRRSYETVLVASKPGGKVNWYDTSNAVENIIRPGERGIRKIIPTADDHPTPKPVELAMHFIRLHTKPGDTVLDPFCGAGWVGAACARMGRKFVGIEIDKRWASRASSVIKTELRACDQSPG